MIIMSYNIVFMKVVIERSNDNDTWMVMIEDMLGKRPYNSKKFDYPNDAYNYITEEFKNCSDFDINIKE